MTPALLSLTLLLAMQAQQDQAITFTAVPVDICMRAGQTKCIEVLCYGRNVVEGCPNYVATLEDELAAWLEEQHREWWDENVGCYTYKAGLPMKRDCSPITNTLPSHAVATTPRRSSKTKKAKVNPFANTSH